MAASVHRFTTQLEDHRPGKAGNCKAGRKQNGAMAEDKVPVLAASELKLLAEENAHAPCPACVALRAPGWEALPGGYDSRQLRKVGTLRQPDVEEPTLEEYHPQGTGAWSADAPIAPGFFPYNRCDVWQCGRCGRPFLRYTEYGGYYVEERIRELQPSLIAGASPGAG
jgi:hypothetical protein